MRPNFAIAGFLALTLSGCAMDGTTYGADASYDGGFYDNGYYDNGYYDGGSYGYGPALYGGYYAPDPGIFYGSIFFGNRWYDGPHRYRDGRLGREFWFRNAWRRAEARPGNNDRGPRNDNRPGQWQDRNPQGSGTVVPPPTQNPRRGGFQGNRPRADANAETPVASRPTRPPEATNPYRGKRVVAPTRPPADQPRARQTPPSRAGGAATAAAAAIRASGRAEQAAEHQE